MDVVTLDFETFYSKDYSLSKMTTEAYVRDPCFEVIGLGFKINDEPSMWVTDANVKRVLNHIDFSNKAILCHHTHFDGAILAWHYGIRPKLWLDTLSMSRPLLNVECAGSLKALAAHHGIGEKGDEVVNALGKRRCDFTPQELAAYGRYCTNDVDLTYALWEKFKPSFPVDEIILIDQTIRMYTEPQFSVDTAVLLQHKLDLQKRATQLLHSVGLGHLPEDEARKQIRSNVIFADLLRKLGVDPPEKVSKTTGKATYAFAKTDRGLLDLQEHDDHRVRDLVSARLGLKSSIEETRTDALIGIANRGSLPIYLRYYGAHTGRFSGADGINPQNLPRGGALRKSLRAPKGKVLVACDSSQIEARMVAWLSDQADLLQAFREKRDVYCEFATEVYGRPITKQDTVERFVGKTCTLGLGYGMGGVRLRETLKIGSGGISADIELSEAHRIVSVYRNKNHKIAAYWRLCDHMLMQMANGGGGWINSKLQYDHEGVILPNGFKIKYPGLRMINTESRTGQLAYINNNREFRKFIKARVSGKDMDAVNWTYIYGGKTCENITQAMARLVVTGQSNHIGRHYPVLLQVHDEIVVCVDEREADNAKALMESVMATPPKWAPDLPVACEAGVGYNYGECK